MGSPRPISSRSVHHRAHRLGSNPCNRRNRLYAPWPLQPETLLVSRDDSGAHAILTLQCQRRDHPETALPTTMGEAGAFMRILAFAGLCAALVVAVPQVAVAQQQDGSRPALPVTEWPSGTYRADFDAWAGERADRITIISGTSQRWTGCRWLSSNADYVLFRCLGEDVRVPWHSIKATATPPNDPTPRGTVIL